MNLYTYLESKIIDANIGNAVNKKLILYHGLKSDPNKPNSLDKKNFLSKNGIYLTQEDHDYKAEYEKDFGHSFMKQQEVIANRYDVIMGISFGGYVAYMLACRLQKPLILINPAINRSVTKTSIKEYDYEYGSVKPPEIEYFYGEKDTQVKFNEHMVIVQKATFHKISGMEHRVPFEKFKSICEQSEILNIKKQEKNKIKEEEKNETI